MAEVINPAIVPKVTLPSGEQVPCVGMGTFGSDRVSAEQLLQARSAAATVCLTVLHATEMSMRLARCSKMLLTKVL